MNLVDKDGDYFENEGALYSHSQDVKKVHFHPVDLTLTSCGFDNTIKIYVPDVNDDFEWYCVDTLHGHRNTVWAISFDSKGKYLASAGADLSLILWDYKKFKTLSNLSVGIDEEEPHPAFIFQKLNLHTEPIYDLKWSRDSKFLCTASGDNSIGVIKFFPKDINEQLQTVAIISEAHSRDVNCLCIIYNSETNVLTAGDDGKLKIWELKNN